MEDLEVCFCRECLSNIISSRLAKFWKCICMSTVTDKEWMYFEEEDKLSMKYIKALEAKNLVVSTDHGRFILLRPRGIYESHKGTYIVCQHYDEHFEDITHEI